VEADFWDDAIYASILRDWISGCPAVVDFGKEVFYSPDT